MYRYLPPFDHLLEYYPTFKYICYFPVAKDAWLLLTLPMEVKGVTITPELCLNCLFPGGGVDIMADLPV